MAVAAANADATAFFHATLLRSAPAANARLTAAPKQIRLVFSEEVVPSLSQLTLIGPLNDSTRLNVSNDPHDVHALLGAVPERFELRASGIYRVYWRVVSADGHPVDGDLSFSVAGAPPTQPAVTRRADTALIHSIAQEDKQRTEELPVLASVLRGVGLAALMAVVGLLFFGATARDIAIAPSAKTIAILTAFGAILLIAHLAAWLYHITPTFAPHEQFIVAALRSKLGVVELARTVLAVAMGICVFAGNRKFALGFGLACLIVSGAVGHSAAIHPIYAVPAKSIHLLAGALWLGGLLWILRTSSTDRDAHQREAMRVSSMALVAVIAILVTGLLQSWFFLNSVGDLLRSSYGRLVLIKIVGLLILIGYGAYNRFSLLPALAVAGVKLRRSVKQEILLIAVLALIGGFLAYIPPPPAAASRTSVTQGGQ